MNFQLNGKSVSSKSRQVGSNSTIPSKFIIMPVPSFWVYFCLFKNSPLGTDSPCMLQILLLFVITFRTSAGCTEIWGGMAYRYSVCLCLHHSVSYAQGKQQSLHDVTVPPYAHQNFLPANLGQLAFRGRL